VNETPRTIDLGALLAGIEDLATGVSGKSRFWGGVALIAAPVSWALLLRRWVFDGIGPFLAWLPLLLGMLIPGLLLFGFARRVRKLGALPDQVSSEISQLIHEARSGVTAQVASVPRTGLGGLRGLLSSLKGLRSYGDDIGGIVAGVAGTFRLVNPLYLLLVALAALSAGALAILAVVAIVVRIV
jgi:hypothetical protein